MATILLGAAGAFATPYDPAMGWAVGSTLGGILFPPKGPTITRGRVDDVRISGSAYGVALPRCYGATLVGGNLIWAGPRTTRTVRTRTGGKGGPSITTETIVATQSLAWTVCKGEIDGIRRIWANDILIYEDGVSDYDVTIYLGTEAQTVDPTIEGVEGVGMAPAYRGQAYVVIASMDLSQFGNQNPNLRVETVPNQRLTSSLSVGGGRTGVSLADGSCLATGRNDDYELGDGTNTDQLTMVDVDLPDGVTSAKVWHAAGGAFSRLEDLDTGDLYFIGEANRGQSGTNEGLGVLSKTAYTLCRQFNGPLLQVYDSDDIYGFVIDADGRLWSSGQREPGGVAVDGYEDGDVEVDEYFDTEVTGCVKVLSKGGRTFLLKDSGKIWHCGLELSTWSAGGFSSSDEDEFQPTDISEVVDFHVSFNGSNGTDEANFCLVALKENGTLWHIGNKTSSRLFGDGSAVGSNADWTQITTNGIDDKTIVQIAGASQAMVALADDGTVFSWGFGKARGRSDTVYDVQECSAFDSLAEVRQLWGCGVTSVNNIFVELEDRTVYTAGHQASSGNDDSGTNLYGAWTLMPWSVTQTSETNLATILAAEMQIAGLTADDYDVSEGETVVVSGFIVADLDPIGTTISPLLRTFFGDLSEYDGKIRLHLRTNDDVHATLSEDDLGVYAWNGQAETPAIVRWTRQQEEDMPRSVEFTYFSSTKDYEQANQKAQSVDLDSAYKTEVVNTPITLGDDEARQRTESILHQMRIEREKCSFATFMRTGLAIVPGSRVNVPSPDGNDVEVIVLRGNGLPIGPLSFQAARRDITVYEQFVGGGSGPASTQTLLQAGETTLVAWNGNALFDSETDDLGLYLAACGGAGWPGCEVYKSVDGGTTYIPILGLGDQATIGVLDASVGGFDQTAVWDEDNTIDVTLERGTLESASDAEVLEGINSCYLGGEYIRFATVTPLGGLSYRLSRLLRGQRGTPIVSHTAGEDFLLLETGSVKRVLFDIGLRGKSLKLKAVTIGKTLAETTAVDLTLTGFEFYPYSPVDIEGTRDGSYNLTVTWKRRTRCEGSLQDGFDVPLCEDSEAYEVDVYDGLTIVRTITGLSSETASYSAAEQTADGLTPGDPVDLIVYQIGKYGRGYGASATV